MKEYSLYVLDMDGVLFRGEDPVPGGPEAVKRLKSAGAKIRYLTNNSTRTRAQYAEFLESLGYSAQPFEIYTSAQGAALFLGSTSAYVVGEHGLRSELKSVGCKIATDTVADWVVVGACWTLTYDMIDEAQWRVRQGAKFLATNLDATFPVEGGRLRPGAGSIVAAIATASEASPDVIIGKPEQTLLRMIWLETGASPEATLLVGDRLDTDIACANAAGCDSALVLTGATTEWKRQGKLGPTYVHETVADL
jgi:4-nitrophenyl phosphatase